MELKFSEFSKFSESDKSMKHELGSIKRSYHLFLIPAMVVSWSITLESTGFIPFYDKYILLLISVKTGKLKC